MKKFTNTWLLLIAITHFGSCLGIVYGLLLTFTPRTELQNPVLGVMITLISAGTQALLQLDAYRENWRNQ